MTAAAPRSAHPHRAVAIPRSAWVALAILLFAYVLAFLDRQIPSLVVEPLKRELGLTDTAVGLLQGLAFALALAVAGLPLGRLVDRGDRALLLAGAVLIWSGMTAASAFAGSFAVLVACRMGVAIGEAVLTPASHAIIADAFPTERMGLALGIYGAGAFVGLGLAYSAGSLVLASVAAYPQLTLLTAGPVDGWRVVFLAVAAPGLIAAGLMVRLPASRPHTTAVSASLKEVVAFFTSGSVPILAVHLSLAFAAMASYAATAWFPTVLIRAHGWTAGQAGSALGPVVVVAGLTASLLGGRLADQAARWIPGGRLLVQALAALAAAPFAFAAPIAETPVGAILAFGAFVLLSSMAISIGPSTQQAMTPSSMRGVMSASGVLSVNLLGLGLGPTLVGFVTDHVLHSPGRLGSALSVSAAAMMLTSCALAIGGLRPYARRLREVSRL